MESLICILPVFCLFPFICKGMVLGLTTEKGGCGLTLFSAIVTSAISMVLFVVVGLLLPSVTRHVIPGTMPPHMINYHPLGLLWWNIYISIAIVAVFSFVVDSFILGHFNFRSLRRATGMAALSNLMMAVTMIAALAIGIEPALNFLS